MNTFLKIIIQIFNKEIEVLVPQNEKYWIK